MHSFYYFAQYFVEIKWIIPAREGDTMLDTPQAKELIFAGLELETACAESRLAGLGVSRFTQPIKSPYAPKSAWIVSVKWISGGLSNEGKAVAKHGFYALGLRLRAPSQRVAGWSLLLGSGDHGIVHVSWAIATPTRPWSSAFEDAQLTRHASRSNPEVLRDAIGVISSGKAQSHGQAISLVQEQKHRGVTFFRHSGLRDRCSKIRDPRGRAQYGAPEWDIFIHSGPSPLGRYACYRSPRRAVLLLNKSRVPVNRFGHATSGSINLGLQTVSRQKLQHLDKSVAAIQTPTRRFQ
ncbi:hypothetical protein BOTBODRAFT_45444 [Botryobasidium botryosum FD-172 SS1]|uniref:Uncharacterized protein n=1 Tax=Botryobasidium botryosum (strain FD-172 SS1) TaxID=930990 RepID=A0A067ME69_BOTB1|nr:hypothetical protein BOTBODRAFT_45444 [Botryobasidium botryosum FD-172 SS1]